MINHQRAMIRYSVQDVIRILENEPVQGDLVPEMPAVQVMNRVSIAHLSIEKVLKFLIKEAGGQIIETHDLKARYQELLRYDSISAKYLEETFEAAVRHYHYKPNATKLTPLESYLEVAGSGRAFQDIRYWELTQSLGEILLRRIFLPIHIELLYGLSEILLAPDRPLHTVAHRVERAIGRAMLPTAKLAYSPGTPKEHSVRSYIAWLQGFNTRSEALTDAVQRGFNIGDDFMANIVRNAYETLLMASDLAVMYFASTTDVLSRQPGEVVPCVEWLGPETKRYGSVKTPAGTALGFIDRGANALWYITPLRNGAVRVSAKAKSQTDARCYLAILLTRPARVIVGGEDRSLRIVGEEYDLFYQNYDEINRRYEGTSNDNTWTHKVTF